MTQLDKVWRAGRKKQPWLWRRSEIHRERDIYICTEIKSTLALVWIREFWPKLCPAFVRISHGAPGKNTAERRHTVELNVSITYNLVEHQYISLSCLYLAIYRSIHSCIHPSIYLTQLQAPECAQGAMWQQRALRGKFSRIRRPGRTHIFQGFKIIVWWIINVILLDSWLWYTTILVYGYSEIIVSITNYYWLLLLTMMRTKHDTLRSVFRVFFLWSCPVGLVYGRCISPGLRVGINMNSTWKLRGCQHWKYHLVI